MLSADDELSNMVEFRVQPKGKNDEARFEKVLQYQRTDEETLAVLRDNHSPWLENPSAFWLCQAPALAGPFDPQAQIVNRYLHTNSDGA